jgi:hypothetical protein
MHPLVYSQVRSSELIQPDGRKSSHGQVDHSWLEGRSAETLAFASVCPPPCGRVVKRTRINLLWEKEKLKKLAHIQLCCCFIIIGIGAGKIFAGYLMGACQTSVMQVASNASNGKQSSASQSSQGISLALLAVTDLSTVDPCEKACRFAVHTA